MFYYWTLIEDIKKCDTQIEYGWCWINCGILISTLLLRMGRMYVASFCLDFH